MVYYYLFGVFLVCSRLLVRGDDRKNVTRSLFDCPGTDRESGTGYCVSILVNQYFTILFNLKVILYVVKTKYRD